MKHPATSRGGFQLRMLNLSFASLFRTETGYTGVARSGIRCGDKLCVLAGVDFPVILRPVGSHHELVSYDFAVGLMHGEA